MDALESARARFPDLGYREFRVLSLIAATPGITARQLQDVTGYDQGQVARILLALYDQERVQRGADPEQPRRYCYSIAPGEAAAALEQAGREVAQRWCSGESAGLELVLAGISRASARERRAIWNQVRAAFRSEIQADLQDGTLSADGETTPVRVRILKRDSDDASLKRLIDMLNYRISDDATLKRLIEILNYRVI
ncbi:MarR family transcriptional regulator [Synechococcus sp. RSCCF101]|uniref:MarR family winged helix-turn-helix transcriptional regulator n=1 Tax=Synechococcus sp. RSCCF101 TaxID=2511069 RepID=UPI001247BECD|nr:MarR family winged helix-turn-helix transcriptional regulator [Synechococcus sp. RSCCF101]QEY33075.1 MarR family transcriptional regulator [Synechococcus sp. RSCCF101]